MASIATGAGRDAYQPDGSPKVIGDILSIAAADIDASDRMRDIDRPFAEALGRAMLVEGQHTPVLVCRLPGRTNWTLVAGAHRHAAAGIFPQLDPLQAIEVSSNALDRRITQISENLFRRELDPLDRATFVADLHQTLRAKARLPQDASAQEIAANARWQKVLKNQSADASAIVADAYGLDAQLGEKLGLSERTIRNDLLLYRRLPPSIIADLREAKHPILANATQLRALAKLDQADQSYVAELLVQGFPTIGEAVAAMQGKAKPSAEDKRLSAFIGNFSRMALTEKKGALFQLRGMLPAGHRLINDAHSSPPDEANRVVVTEALDAALTLLIAFCDGEPVDDDAIFAARSKVQTALMLCNGGAVPFGEPS